MSALVAAEADCCSTYPTTPMYGTRILHCLQCRCDFLGSFAALSSLPPWWSVSSQGLQLSYALYVARKLGHPMWFPIGGPPHTSSGWLSVGLCSVSTVRQFSASLMKARRRVAVSVLGYLACVWHVRPSSAYRDYCSRRRNSRDWRACHNINNP